MIFPKEWRHQGNWKHGALRVNNGKSPDWPNACKDWKLDTRTGKEGKFFFSDEVCNILECAPETLEHSFDAFFAYVHPDDLEKSTLLSKGTRRQGIRD